MNLFNLVHIQENRKDAFFLKKLALKNESHRRPEMQGAAFIWLKKNVTVKNSRKLNTVAMILRYKFCDKAITEQNSV